MLKPLVAKATEDYLERPMAAPERGVYVSHDLLDNLEHQEKLYDYLDFRTNALITMAEPALSTLPQSTKFAFGTNGDIGNDLDMVEIATHLVKFWVCQIFMSLNPENRKALLKGAHLISSITVLVINTWTLGCLGSLLKLGSFFDVDDPELSLFDWRITCPRSTTLETKHHEAILRSKLTQAVYAMIGWYHFQDARAAMKWGIKWFTPLVTRAHDIITEGPSFKPCLPHGASDTLAFHAAALQVIQDSQDIDPLSKEEELEARFAAMVLKDQKPKKAPFNTKIAANHRLTIDLDDFGYDEDPSKEDTASCNEASPVEALIPTLVNLQIVPIERTQGTQAVGSTLSKGVSRSYCIMILESPCTCQGRRYEGYRVNNQLPISVVHEPRSTPEPKVIRNEKRPFTLPGCQNSVTRCREPPREPRAMREQRSRGKRTSVAGEQWSLEASLKHSRLEEPENDSCHRSRRRT